MQLTKEQVRQRWSELQDMVVEWDPLGLIAMGSPRDEYDCLVGQLLRRLQEQEPTSAIVDYLCGEFADHFGLTVERSSIEGFVKKASDWRAERWHSPHV
ncbi:MAG: hypothetical protein L0Y66_24810 [Myxococcaceae bacterium]|nr:hypothetical protein [Myxococcaceae bacterium]MCI0669249.1 hypothetical protein [Myxococcaceae bacterium]